MWLTSWEQHSTRTLLECQHFCWKRCLSWCSFFKKIYHCITFIYLWIPLFLFYIKFVRNVPHTKVCERTLFLLLPSKYPKLFPLPFPFPNCSCFPALCLKFDILLLVPAAPPAPPLSRPWSPSSPSRKHFVFVYLQQIEFKCDFYQIIFI